MGSGSDNFWDVIAAARVVDRDYRESMRSARDDAPLAHVVSGRWPDVVLDVGAPVSATAALGLARNIIDAAEKAEISMREVSKRAGVSSSTLTRIVAGQVLCDIGTLARLEAALDVDLWPSHKQWAPSES